MEKYMGNIIKNGKIDKKINDKYFFVSDGKIIPITYNQLSIIGNKHFESRDLYSIKILNRYYLSFEIDSLKKIKDKDSVLDEIFKDYWDFYPECVEKEGSKPSEIIYYINRELSARDFKVLCIYFKSKGVDCLNLLKEELSNEAFDLVNENNLN